MSMIRWTAATAASALLAGCATKPTPVQHAPPVREMQPALTLSQARADLQSVNPLASVGVVSGVRADRQFVAIADMPTDRLALGDPISIVKSDRDMTPVTIGPVYSIANGMVIVKYESNRGIPAQGDFAVRVPLRPGASMRVRPTANMSNVPQKTTAAESAIPTGGATGAGAGNQVTEPSNTAGADIASHPTAGSRTTATHAEPSSSTPPATAPAASSEVTAPSSVDHAEHPAANHPAGDHTGTVTGDSSAGTGSSQPLPAPKEIPAPPAPPADGAAPGPVKTQTPADQSQPPDNADKNRDLNK
jgi:hypothetical protein